MSQAEPLYVQEKYTDSGEAHQKLTSVISDIKADLESGDPGHYSVAWATENHNHGSEYKVFDVNNRIPDDTLQIIGASRGGKYDLVPHYGERPKIRYHQPEFGDIKWNEGVIELVIMAGIFDYEPENGFLSSIKNTVPW